MISNADILAARILIVDDQLANVTLLEQLLSDAGYKQVSSTQEPRRVCALHRQNHYDLILLDLQMPGMDGFEVLAGLKANVGDDYLPVLVITAQPAHKLRALQAGAKDFVSKPFDLIEVKTRIRNMLEVRLLYRQLETFNAELERTVQERTAELRESEARYRSLTELASDWYWNRTKRVLLSASRDRCSKCSGCVSTRFRENEPSNACQAGTKRSVRYCNGKSPPASPFWILSSAV